MEKILVIGANGQLGSELTEALRSKWGSGQVIASDLRMPATTGSTTTHFIQLDALDKARLYQIVEEEQISQIYHLAAVLSATGEKNPHWAWKLNMDSLFNVLEAARELMVSKVFWPSSIAVFGPATPREMTPQYTVCNPSTIYGISKLAGEQWCEYYWHKWGVDVRSLRYPGLIGYKSLPGGGTTDYAVDIFHQALERGSYTSFLSKDTYLPMMYMPDAIDATLQLMDAPAASLSIRSSYNVAGLSFSPQELSQAIRRLLPEFQISYQADYRQQIADSWPKSIDDSVARSDWGWAPTYSLDQMSQDMLEQLSKKQPI